MRVVRVESFGSREVADIDDLVAALPRIDLPPCPPLTPLGSCATQACTVRPWALRSWMLWE